MLSSLTLNNVALIKKQNIDFENGFNCLLGQSGAGKSIVIDALSFVLGAKADKNLVRTGEQNMRVDAVFSNISNEEREILSEFEIDCDDDLIITRSLSVDGKSSIKINGYPVTAKTLQLLAEKLVDFCGQHDSVGLLNANNHLSFLDKFAGGEVEDLKKNVAAALDQLREVEDKIKSIGGNEQERAREKDILQFQIDELENANLKVGEEEELRERLNFISSAEKIYEKLGDALLKLADQRENVVSMLYEAKSDLSSFCDFKDIEECRERLENSYYEVKDVAETLDSIKQNTEFDANELERLDNRLDLIKNLSKKYGKSIEAMLEYLQTCKDRLNELDDSEFALERLEKDHGLKMKNLEDACQKLSETRQKYAKDFEKQIMTQLDDLEMKGTQFEVCFERKDFSKNGYDNVKFVFSANKGQAVKELHKTASGGELSRLLLAFKNVMLGKENVQTIVFDEIDSGISGRTAEKLAQKLSNIAKFTQIICITHTPIVASKADNFLLVEKKVVDNSTVSTIKTLAGDEIVCEVARLIDGSATVTETAILHTKKLLSEK